ncbi:MAG: hypothetical protein LBE09_05235, partial [Christensenellaceae bacterium]|nr:hypothetical protein [Christensenellaceae bacterium]
DGYYDSNNNYVAPINIEHYPNIKEYFDKLGPKFKNRPEQGVTPYNLRSCKYMHAFSKQKIIYSEIVQSPQFYLDRDGKFMVEATAFMLTGVHLEYLVNFLNSEIVAWIFKKFYAGGGLGDTGFRYKKAFIEKLPIPKPKDDKVIYTDKEIATLYGFDDEETNYILSLLNSQRKK